MASKSLCTKTARSSWRCRSTHGQLSSYGLNQRNSFQLTGTSCWRTYRVISKFSELGAHSSHVKQSVSLVCHRYMHWFFFKMEWQAMLTRNYSRLLLAPNFPLSDWSWWVIRVIDSSQFFSKTNRYRVHNSYSSSILLDVFLGTEKAAMNGLTHSSSLVYSTFFFNYTLKKLFTFKSTHKFINEHVSLMQLYKMMFA